MYGCQVSNFLAAYWQYHITLTNRETNNQFRGLYVCGILVLISVSLSHRYSAGTRPAWLRIPQVPQGLILAPTLFLTYVDDALNVTIIISNVHGLFLRSPLVE